MAMETQSSRLLHGLLLCCLAAVLPPALHAQDRPQPQDNRQARPAEGAKPQTRPAARPAANPRQNVGQGTSRDRLDEPPGVRLVGRRKTWSAGPDSTTRPWYMTSA